MNVMMVVVMVMTTANVNTTEDSPPEFVPESLRGFMTNSEWDELLSRADYLITSLESIDDSNTRQSVFELLKVLDKIHRESLTRLVRLFKDGVLEQVITDPPIRTLMDLYDLLPQSLGCSDTDSASIALNSKKLARWVPSRFSEEKLKDDLLYSDQIEDHFLFLAKVENKIYGFSADCLVNHELMIGATLEGYSLVCPHHDGCIYDIRNGAKLGSDAHIGCYPVKKEKNRILIGFDMPFIPELPSF